MFIDLLELQGLITDSCSLQQVQGSDRSPPNSDVGRQLAEIAAQLDEHYFRDETGYVQYWYILNVITIDHN